jgi:hypothetical protein
MEGALFEKVHNQDISFSLRIDQIGSFLIPLDNQWIRQWQAAKSYPKFRVALVIEAIATIVMIGALTAGLRLALEVSRY